jgi:hypothetical protein
METRGLNHLAMSVPRGTLSDEWRAEILDFYGPLLGWTELEALRQEDRMTLAVGHHTYVNIRERDDVMTCHGYEHFGIVMQTVDDADACWQSLSNESRDVNLSECTRGDDGYRVFRFRYLLPMAVEVQYFPR